MVCICGCVTTTAGFFNYSDNDLGEREIIFKQYILVKRELKHIGINEITICFRK